MDKSEAGKTEHGKSRYNIELNLQGTTHWQFTSSPKSIGSEILWSEWSEIKSLDRWHIQYFYTKCPEYELNIYEKFSKNKKSDFVL